MVSDSDYFLYHIRQIVKYVRIFILCDSEPVELLMFIGVG